LFHPSFSHAGIPQGGYNLFPTILHENGTQNQVNCNIFYIFLKKKINNHSKKVITFRKSLLFTLSEDEKGSEATSAAEFTSERRRHH